MIKFRVLGNTGKNVKGREHVKICLDSVWSVLFLNACPNSSAFKKGNDWLYLSKTVNLLSKECELIGILSRRCP